jgi:hypothetical protein
VRYFWVIIIGNLYELRRKIGDDRWLFCDIHQQIKDLPQVTEIYSSATLTLTNSVIYYKVKKISTPGNLISQDSEHNIIELACNWDLTFSSSKWYWKNLSALPRFLALPKPAGRVLSYSKVFKLKV